MEYATLQNGLKMPMEGFGVFQVRDKEECKRSVLDAIRTGYRLIDTAASYTNEDAVGEAVREAIAEGICTREELFITSKMWVQDMQNYEMAKAAIDASLEKTGLEYLDLYLLHQAMKDYFSAWRAMEDAYRDGKLKAIGVSNFYPHVLTNFCETVEIQPMVNQVELHPYFTQENALATMKKYNIVPEQFTVSIKAKPLWISMLRIRTGSLPQRNMSVMMTGQSVKSRRPRAICLIPQSIRSVQNRSFIRWNTIRPQMMLPNRL